MEYFGSLREQIVDSLTVEHGNKLELLTRIISRDQIDLYIESMALEGLGSKYAQQRSEKMQRLSCSWQGESRKELKEIGQTPEYNSGKAGGAQDFRWGSMSTKPGTRCIIRGSTTP